MTEEASKPVLYALIELFGHARIAGAVSEQNFGGANLIRVDVPEVTFSAVDYGAPRGPDGYAKVTRTIPAHKPLKGIRPLWRELREPQHRLKKAGAERLKDGSIAKNPQRMGPLTFEARLMGLERILGIQAEINAAARAQRRPEISLINAEEEARIRELIDLQTWPDGWDGDEPTAHTVMETVYQNGAVQPLLFSAEDA